MQFIANHLNSEWERSPTLRAEPVLTTRQQWAVDQLDELKAKGYFANPDYQKFAINELQKFAHYLPQAEQAQLETLLNCY